MFMFVGMILVIDSVIKKAMFILISLVISRTKTMGGSVNQEA